MANLTDSAVKSLKSATSSGADERSADHCRGRRLRRIQIYDRLAKQAKPDKTEIERGSVRFPSTTRATRISPALRSTSCWRWKAPVSPWTIRTQARVPRAERVFRTFEVSKAARPGRRAKRIASRQVLRSRADRLHCARRDSPRGIVPCHIATSAQQAVAMGPFLSFPVVLKGISPNLPHRMEIGLTRLGIEDPNSVAEACASLQDARSRHAGRHPRACIVGQSVVGSGVELVLGIQNKPHFGSLVVVSVGGMLAENAPMRLLRGVRGKGLSTLTPQPPASRPWRVFGEATQEIFATTEISPLWRGRAPGVRRGDQSDVRGSMTQTKQPS
ncbi:hypothetical protein GWE18_38830 [Bradyrhizobium sp. CSA112]|nr:hypothetical protein [Bradyrhizobium sp. CSA112]